MTKIIVAIALAACAAGAPATAAEQSPRDILRANNNATGGSAWNGNATLQVEYAYSGQGLTGWVRSLEDLKNLRFTDSYAVGPETGASGFDGARPWLKDTSGTVSYQEGGDTPELSVNEAYRDDNLWWRADFGGAAVVSGGTKSEGDADYDVLTVTPKNGKSFDAWFDAQTHLLARIVEVQGSQTETTNFSDYRAVDGVKIAGKEVSDDGSGAKYVQTFTLSKAEFPPEQGAAAYARPTVTITDFSIAGGAAETTIPFRLLNNHIYANRWARRRAAAPAKRRSIRGKAASTR